MNFIIEDGKMVFSFIFEHEPYKGRIFLAAMDIVCNNLLCNCADAVFFVQEVDENGKFIDNSHIHNFTIDILKREVSKHFRSKTSGADLKFAEHFISELTEDTWHTFYERLSECKTVNLSDYKIIDSLEVDFSHKESGIEAEGYMVGFTEIFPHNRNFIIEYNQTRYLVDDQYCLSSSCNCTHAAITFVPATEKGKAKRDSLVILYDYRKGTWEKEEAYNKAEYPEEQQLVKQWETVFPGIRKTLKERHSALRQIYANYRRRKGKHEQVINDPALKVGRNDPCPCGSGKKYKHCCG